MNEVIMIGRIVETPEINLIGTKQTKLAKYRLAVDNSFADAEGNPRTSFFNCETFGKTADFVEAHLEKGDKILIVGELRSDSYTDKDGQKRYSVNILVNRHEFVETKAEKERRKAASTAATQPAAPQYQPQYAAPVQTVAPAPQYAAPAPAPAPQPQYAAPVQNVAPAPQYSVPVQTTAPAPAPQPQPQYAAPVQTVAPPQPVSPVAPIIPGAGFINMADAMPDMALPFN